MLFVATDTEAYSSAVSLLANIVPFSAEKNSDCSLLYNVVIDSKH